ncbi:MAG: GLPGLI family protein [Prevotellaceae bacterium]|nr:GLPGLI family protein [Prevotellaceae bacterium]
MKKRILMIVCMTLAVAYCYAQWKQGDVPPANTRQTKATVIDTAQVTVYYAFNADDIKDENTYIDLGWLLVGKHYTKYASYFMAHSDSTYGEIGKKNVPTGTALRQKNGGKFPTAWSEYQYDELFIKDGKLTEYAILPFAMGRYNCQYTEAYPMQQWTLLDEQQTIHGYRCQKATCHWRGRDYVAWFTADIPIRKGPWKFGGLPGLIVKISDAKKEYNFELVKLERTKRPIVQYDFHTFKTVKREYMLKLQKKININWITVLYGTPAAGLDGHTFPDHPYSPMELE